MASVGRSFERENGPESCADAGRSVAAVSCGEVVVVAASNAFCLGSNKERAAWFRAAIKRTGVTDGEAEPSPTFEEEDDDAKEVEDEDDEDERELGITCCKIANTFLNS